MLAVRLVGVFCVAWCVNLWCLVCELVVLVRWYLLFVEKTFGQEQISCEASLLYCVAPIVDTEALWCSRMPISEKQLHRCELSLHFNIEIDHTAHGAFL